jgi:hypothetical protein
MQDTTRNPVWSVYDKLRTARLNVKYYGQCLQYLEWINYFFEFSLLVTAPSSAVAGLWLWTTPGGTQVWKVFGGIAAVIALVRPILNLTKRIKDLESILSGYRTLHFDLMEIKTQIEQKGTYDASAESELKKAIQREKILVGRDPESREIAWIKRRCQAEVLAELPTDCFFVPKITKRTRSSGKTKVSV